MLLLARPLGLLSFDATGHVQVAHGQRETMVQGWTDAYEEMRPKEKDDEIVMAT